MPYPFFNTKSTQVMLQKHGHYNDLSPELRKELTEKISGYGKKVRYKFNISHENPDPQKYNGAIVWPFMYVLDPCTFRVTDPHEKRENVSKAKEIGLIDKLDKDGKPEKFYKIKIWARHQGILTFDLEEPGDFDMVMYLELHPKLKGGKFAAKDKQQLVERIDEQKEARTQREQRSAKIKALRVAEEMSEDQIKKFADAMLWDSTEGMALLQNKVEALAESNPEFFNDLVAGKNVEYQATVKRAMDSQIIGFDPAEYKYIWSSNQQTITVLQPVGTKNHVEKLAEWLMTGGHKSDEVYKKIKSLLK
jgi:hypothetical protein